MIESGLELKSSCTRTIVIRLALVDGMLVVVAPRDEAGVGWPVDPVAPPVAAVVGELSGPLAVVEDEVRGPSAHGSGADREPLRVCNRNGGC